MIQFQFLSQKQNHLLFLFYNELFTFKHLLTKNQPEKEIQRLITDGVLSGQAFFSLFKDNPSSLPDQTHHSIVDVGSGFGFPGIVFSILSPENRFILLEPSEKRSEFLKHCVSKLKLKAEVRPHPLEAMNEEIFLFKAFASFDRTLTLMKKYLKPNAVSYHFKSLQFKKEWENLNEKQKSFWKMSVFAEYEFESQKRFIIRINQSSK